MANVVEFPSRSGGADEWELLAARVRDIISKELWSRGIDRPDIGEAFGAKLKELLMDWCKQPGVKFELDGESHLSDAALRSLDAGVGEFRNRAAAAIGHAFITAAASAVVASFDGA